MTVSFSVLNANIGSMYLWSVKDRLPTPLGNLYASFFNFGRSTASGLESFAQLIHRYRPTVVCLQEIYGATSPLPDQGNELERMVGQQYKLFADGFRGENKAILIRQNAVNGYEPENITTENGVPVGIAYRLSPPTIWIASIHLRYSNLAERYQQMKDLMHWASSKREPILLAGDFNTHIPFAPPGKRQAAYRTFQALREAHFLDLSGAIDCTWRWGKYFPFAGKIKLDHFFGRGVLAMERPFTLREHLRGWMDHLALFGEFATE